MIMANNVPDGESATDADIDDYFSSIDDNFNDRISSLAADAFLADFEMHVQIVSHDHWSQKPLPYLNATTTGAGLDDDALCACIRRLKVDIHISCCHGRKAALKALAALLTRTRSVTTVRAVLHAENGNLISDVCGKLDRGFRRLRDDYDGDLEFEVSVARSGAMQNADAETEDDEARADEMEDGGAEAEELGDGKAEMDAERATAKAAYERQAQDEIDAHLAMDSEE